MDTIAYVLIALALVVGVANVAVSLALFFKKKGEGVSRSELMAESESIKKYVADTVKFENGMLVSALNVQNENTRALIAHSESAMATNGDRIDRLSKDMLAGINDLKLSGAENSAALTLSVKQELGSVKDASAALTLSVKKELETVKDASAAGVKEMRESNERQLEKMRQTVDEKLEATLDARFKQSFQIVNERLEEINRAAVELQNLQTGVKDLNKIFNNVKTRGTWGEVSLAGLLEQILAPEQYAAQVRLKRGKGEAVDFAIRMQNDVLLPVDAKFPLEAYYRLATAANDGDRAGAEAASKALGEAIKIQARSIRDKYIDPPKTTDFAIMYLPTEGLYAEVVRNTALVEELRNMHRVVVCGPTTFAALLNSLQMGFQSLAVEKRSKEIGKLFRAFIKDFTTFEDLLQKTRKNIDIVGKTIDDAEKRTDILRKKLDKVYELTKDDIDEISGRQEAASDEINVPLVESTRYFDGEDE